MLATPTHTRNRSATPVEVFEKFCTNNVLGGRVGTWHTLRAYFIPHPKRGKDLIVTFGDTIKDHQEFANILREFKADAGLDGWQDATEYYKEIKTIEAEHTMGEIHLLVPDEQGHPILQTLVPDAPDAVYHVALSIYMRQTTDRRADRLTHPERIRGDALLDNAIDALLEAYREVRER